MEHLDEGVPAIEELWSEVIDELGISLTTVVEFRDFVVVTRLFSEVVLLLGGGEEL